MTKQAYILTYSGTSLNSKIQKTALHIHPLPFNNLKTSIYENREDEKPRIDAARLPGGFHTHRQESIFTYVERSQQKSRGNASLHKAEVGRMMSLWGRCALHQ